MERVLFTYETLSNYAHKDLRHGTLLQDFRLPQQAPRKKNLRGYPRDLSDNTWPILFNSCYRRTLEAIKGTLPDNTLAHAIQ